MAPSRQSEVLSVTPAAPAAASLQARLRGPAGIFRDENLAAIAHLLDSAFRIPGTGIRFGVDGIVGLVPGLGDVLAGLLSLIIPLAAWMRGVPRITLLRMGANLAIDVGIGAIPLLGDLFDIAWKANQRNYALLRRHLEQPRRHTWRDWIFLLLLAAALMVVFALPLLLLGLLIKWLRGPAAAG